MVSLINVYRFYDYFFNKKYGTNYRLTKTTKNDSFCKTFLELCEKEYGKIGKEFLFTYMLFQFEYWEQVEFAGGNVYRGQIQLTFIIGKKAFERYKNRDKSWDWTFETLPLIKKYGLRKQDLIEQLSTKHKIVVKKDIDTEAAIKLAYYNTVEGYKLCGDYSTLFNHKSTICKVCIYKDDCKERLKESYPTLYKDRGYK